MDRGADTCIERGTGSCRTLVRLRGVDRGGGNCTNRGAHTIGRTACFFVQKRPYNFTEAPTGSSDPEINPKFLPKLKAMCPFGKVNNKIPLDQGTSFIFDASDANLYHDNKTKPILDSYISTGSGKSFKSDFGKAMVKMGNIGVKTDPEGEIRRVCSAVN
ncbi:hypothetical protein Ddye_001090 [Dipteronia dyeriana]|uniref:peroxidase n=1 Tax=Dipteronia dyeriana TaxID=168575 RepID=A0AAE0CT68_9ROSI|nr:hypothetical protein Ddye_001090 [Dipteronia dyeriana]